MTNWPENYCDSWTLGDSASMTGIGLHTGQKSKVNLHPTDKPGFHISWSGENKKPVTLSPSQVKNSPLCTTIEIDGKKIATVEHLLAALVGCGLTHVHIEVTGSEVPLLDGSALSWVEVIEQSKIVKSSSPKKTGPILTQSISLNRGLSFINATPSENFKLIGIIDFPYEAIGTQMFSIELTPKKFVEEIAPARTFGFADQLAELKKAGLIKGGALNNALVCDGSSWINPPLRFKDEPVRHKLLDLIGDLALVGIPNAQILVYKGSHALHADLSSALVKFSKSN